MKDSAIEVISEASDFTSRPLMVVIAVTMAELSFDAEVFSWFDSSFIMLRCDAFSSKKLASSEDLVGCWFGDALDLG